MRHNNKGMSLVEIVTVVAILSLLVGIVSYGFSLSSSRDVDTCAQKLSSSIQHTRTVTMGKNKTTITIKYKDEKIVVNEFVQIRKDDGTLVPNNKETVLGKKGVTLRYTLEGGSELVLAATDSLELEFDRGSGALLKTRINGTEVALCKGLRVVRGSKNATIDIVPLTGKVTVRN